MRILFSFLFSIFLSMNVSAQGAYTQSLEQPQLVGVSSKLPGAVKLHMVPGLRKSDYILTFNNLDSPDYYEAETLVIHGTREDLEKFYLFLKNGFSSKENQMWKLGDEEEIMVSNAYSSIRIAVIRKNGLNSLFFLSRKQLERLFGKE